MNHLTVVTPIFNGARFLAPAIESVLGQSFTDFEYLLLDDGSTDASYDIAAEFARRDNRICLRRSLTNQGISRTLNDALALANGDYVAILDHDDVALPDRLTRQVAFLDENPTVAAVGSQVQEIDASGAELRIRALPTHAALASWDLLLRCCIQHSAAMMRRASVQLVGGYAAHQRYAVEYDLFWRLTRHWKIVNLPEVLTAHRLDAGQTSQKQAQIQHAEVTLWQWGLYRNWLGVETTPTVVQALYAANRGVSLIEADQLMAAADLLEALYRSYLARVQTDAETSALIGGEVARKLITFAASDSSLVPTQVAELQQRASHYTPVVPRA